MTTRSRLPLLAAMAALALLAGPVAAADLGTAGEALRREVLAPLHQGHAEATGALAAVRPTCDAGDPAWRDAYRPAFAGAIVAWRRLEAAGYGPATAPEAAARVYFWPDRHGTAGRQLAAALRERDPALTEPSGLAGRSAGLQSLAALELLLHGPLPPGGADGERFACRFAGAIAGFQAGVAQDLVASFAKDTVPGAAVAEGLVAGARTTLDAVVALDLERPLGASLDEARGERARAWRSGLSLSLIGAALGTVEAVLTRPDGFPPLLSLGPETATVIPVLRGRIAAAHEALGGVTAPLHLAVADPGQRPRVEAALEELRAARRIVVERLAPALGLALGFNALDGD